MIKLIRPILDRPFFYESFHKLIGADSRTREMVKQYIRPQPGDRLLDIGCGPGNIVPFLPECNYLGFDSSESYIAAAKARYSHRGQFLCERVSDHTVQQFGTFDIVLALGLIHHLDDSETQDLFRLGHAALKPGGRLITMDGCLAPKQSFAARYLLSRDRGQFVRTQPQYEAWAKTCFNDVKSYLREGMLKIPYPHLVMVCTR